MHTSRTSRLFTLPEDLLFVDEDVGIVLPELSEDQQLPPEALFIEEEEEDEEEDEEDDLSDSGARAPAQLFVGLPVKVSMADLDAADEEIEDDILGEWPMEEPVKLRLVPPLAVPTPSLAAAAAADSVAEDDVIVHIEIIDEEGYEDVTEDVAITAQPEDVPSEPAALIVPEAHTTRPLWLGVALVAAMLLLWVSA